MASSILHLFDMKIVSQNITTTSKSKFVAVGSSVISANARGIFPSVVMEDDRRSHSIGLKDTFDDMLMPHALTGLYINYPFSS